jgi:hypothetical protein
MTDEEAFVRSFIIHYFFSGLLRFGVRSAASSRYAAWDGCSCSGTRTREAAFLRFG